MKSFKMFISCFIIVIFCANQYPTQVLGVQIPDQVKIGLTSTYQNVSQIHIENTNIRIAVEQDHSTDIYAASGFTVKGGTAGYFAVMDAVYPEYAGAKQERDRLLGRGYPAAVAVQGPYQWKVYTGPYFSQGEAQQITYTIGGTVAAPLAARALLTIDNVLFMVLDNQGAVPQIVDANKEPLRLGERSYRGGIEVYGSGGNVSAVNVLSIDEYLYSTVPSEMFSTWHMEALKAQAVAARNYAITRMGVHEGTHYDLCDSTHCQVYNGFGNEAENATKAVQETAGILAYYNGEPINAVFFSSSGGVTEDSENVWTNAFPYLRSVADVNETTGKVWTRSFSFGEITTLLNQSGANIGTVTDVYIGSVAQSGRVAELVIKGTAGEKKLYKEDIRTFFAGSTGGALESRYFQIGNSSETVPGLVYVSDGTTKYQLSVENIYATDGNQPEPVQVAGNEIAVTDGAETIQYGQNQMAAVSGDIVFVGRGWGHGVGMSQHGANGMAQMGYTYDQILKHYYTGIEIR